MNCPNCGTQNDPQSSFCINCGQTLAGTPRVSGLSPTTRAQRHLLSVTTGRIVISLLLIWLARTILIRLSFIEGLLIPDIPFAVEALITFIAYVAALVLLLVYAQALRVLWPLAFPRASGVGAALAGVIYVLILSFVYAALRPVLLSLIDNPEDVLLVLRIVLAVLALILLGWAWQVIYHSLPGWLAGIRFDIPITSQVACRNCGQVNPAGMTYCGYCAHTLVEGGEADVEA